MSFGFGSQYLALRTTTWMFQNFKSLGKICSNSFGFFGEPLAGEIHNCIVGVEVFEFVFEGILVVRKRFAGCWSGHLNRDL